MEENKDPALQHALPAYWNQLAEIEPEAVCRRAMLPPFTSDGYRIPFLNKSILADIESKQLIAEFDGSRVALDDPLQELIILLYLINAEETPLAGEMVTVKELSEWHFFVGVHALDVRKVADRFGFDPDKFARAAEAIGGQRLDLADVSYRFQPLPRVPVTYLLWLGDDEFAPNVTVCFDRTIERHFAADGIWGLVKRLSRALVTGT